MRRNSQRSAEAAGTTGAAAADGPLRDTKHRIQETALDLFARHGYEKTSLREIAEHLGITKAALYYHFTSKQELLKSVTQPLIDEFEQLLSRHLPPEELLRDYVDLLSRHLRVFEIVVSDQSSLVAAELAERSVALRREAVRQLAGSDATPAGFVRASAAIGAVTQGFMLAMQVEPGADPAEGEGGEAVAYPEGEELAAVLIDAAIRVLTPR